jgi:CPA2 family monovalent cation:H+ antiporter-2
MEVSVRDLMQNWRVTVLGTLLQIVVTVLCVWGVGQWLDWPLPRVILMGFALSLSSTAVVVSILRGWGQLDSLAGRDALGILLAQDVAVIPMLITVGLLAGDSPSKMQLVLQLVGAAGVIGILVLLARRTTISLPFGWVLSSDHELQIFGATLICFGLSLITALLGLSTALGAFLAGVVVAAANETDWVHRSLESFRVIFVAMFFVSIGMLIDVEFLKESWRAMLLLVFVALMTNTLVNAGLLRVLGRSWPSSLYVGAMLAQLGEFSFVIAAVGLQAAIISDFAYNATIVIIALSLFLSPAWIVFVRRLVHV